ncbi:MAG: ABC transporter ATP-binding protein [Alphaproteobacteria bacterium]|nr:ABC transporter ATP-binding protein/permease [Alphaproteobacteria bacterium]MDE2336307.1 ABC transporter ATP-binding protein [Alphaproteobacteria bacterium]
MTPVKENTAGYRDVLRFAAHYWRQGLRLGAAAAALMMAAVTMDSIVPVYTGRIVDAMSRHGTHDAAALRQAWAAFRGFIVLALFNVAFRTGSMFCWNRFAVHNLYRIVTDGMRKVQRFSADWHANTFAGGTVRKITRGMWAFDQFEDTILMGLLPAVTIVISITAMLCTKLPLVGAATAALIVVYCALNIWASVKILKPRFIASAAQDTKMGATLADIIVGNPTVKSFGAETREESLFGKVAAVWREKANIAWQTALAADGARTLLRIFMNGVMLALTIWLWHEGRASPGDIVVVITTFFIIGGYLRDIGMHINHLQRSMSDMEDAVVFWMREDDVVDAAGAKPLVVGRTRRPDLISFAHVDFGYSAQGNRIYEDLCIDIAAGERLALVGPSGSGKSTFVKLLQRLYNLNGGRILIDGQDIAQVTLESLRQAISLVPQDPILFHRSLSDNIAYGSPQATQEQIVAAAKKAYAHDFIMGLPLGYDTLVGERGVKLSGGERQRVAIARAILADAPVLILDEATSSLDSVSEHYIQMALAALMEGRTTITIAHRLSTIRQADRIIVFNQGRIVEQGTHQSLLARPDSHYKKLYEMQVSGLSETAIVA